MDVYAIERFCERWIDKASRYQSNELEDLFDRFFTLYVAYNRLYSAAAELYRNSVGEVVARSLHGDRKEATFVMAKLIGEATFSKFIEDNPALSSACRDISDLLDGHRFYLHSKRGTAERDLVRDERLSRGLSHCSLLAVLECLYQIRCNIFHGHKEFAPRQAELLIPAIALLEGVVALSANVLRDAAY